MADSETDLFYILSLSGGGIRGLFQAVYLREFQTYFMGSKRLHETFNLIAGTSTGAIIAVGLGLGEEPRTIAELFEQKGPAIFPRKRFHWGKWKVSLFCKGPRYDPAPLRAALTGVFGAKRLGECRTNVAVPATLLDEYKMRVFASYPRCDKAVMADAHLLAVEVVMASSAAPLFFPAVQTLHKKPEVGEEDARFYVDGGVWANNPAFIAIMQAHKHLGIPFEKMRVVSLGNGEIPEGIVGTDFNTTLRAGMIQPVLNMLFATQSEMADEAVSRLVGEMNVYRINLPLAGEGIALDDADTAIRELRGRAIDKGRNGGRQLANFLKAKLG